MKRGLVLLFFLTCCVSPQISVNRNADFSKIKRIAVFEFKGPEKELASDMFTITLLKYGIDVVERQHIEKIIKEIELSNSDFTDPTTRKKIARLLAVDAFIVGNVTNYKPQAKYLMKDSSQTFSPVSEIKGKNIFIGNFDPTTDTYILETTLEIGMSARLIDVESGSIMWAGHLTYEGLDLSTTLSTVCDYLVKSLSHYLKPKPS
ncbi:MAG: CsgG/HfaB family protein [Elusimicrobiales bacterium]